MSVDVNMPESDEIQTSNSVNVIELISDSPADKIKKITARLEQGVTELFESERYKEYLRVMSKFHNYSFNNTLLIAIQKPDASLVAGFSSWKNNFGRTVKKGEKGIKIIAPAPSKRTEERQLIDPDTRLPMLDENGEPLKVKVELVIPKYKVVHVFDVSQTEGRELPDIAVDELTGDVGQYHEFLDALVSVSPVPVGFESISGGAHGYYSPIEKRIAVKDDLSEIQTLKTLIHEIAHAMLHDVDPSAIKEGISNLPDRYTREVQAESVAYVVCQHYGLDSSEYSFGYIAGWSKGKELTELKCSLETIRNAAAEIIDGIDEQLADPQRTGDKAKDTEDIQPKKKREREYAR